MDHTTHSLFGVFFSLDLGLYLIVFVLIVFVGFSQYMYSRFAV